MKPVLGRLPKRLIEDAIMEALVEVRFECLESSQMPEVVVGRLVDWELWRSYSTVRLPLSDIPPAIRAQNPDLQYQALMELRSPGNARVAKIGSNVLSYHAMAPYPGGTVFKQELAEILVRLFGSFKNFQANRIGLRYVNILTEKAHGISDLSQLNFSFIVDGVPLHVPQLLSYERMYEDKYIATVRVSSPKFVSGNVPGAFTGLIDVDVATPKELRFVSSADAMTWIDQAHLYEKAEFFELLTEETISRLRAD